MNPIFIGTVRSGKLQLSKLALFNDHLRSLEGKTVEVTVETLTHSRTNNQNRYYFGVVVAEIARHTGHDPEDVHELLKMRFSPKWRFSAPVSALAPKDFETTPSEPLGVAIPTSTTRLDTLAFVEYTEKCRVWANEFLGLQIPLPGEVTV